MLKTTMQSKHAAGFRANSNTVRPILANRPRAIYVELTDGCNLSCAMCRSAVLKGNVLPLATFQEIAEELFPGAHFVDLRGWGESLILPNFESYLDLATAHAHLVKIITNAALKRERLYRRLVEAGLLIGVSFDAVEPALFERLRRGANFDVVVRNIRAMVDECERSGRSPVESLYLCVTVSGANLKQVPAIVRFARELGLGWIKLEPLKGEASDPDLLEKHVTAVRSMQDDAIAVSRKLSVRVDLSASLIPELSERDKIHKLCIHPWDYLYVSARGRLGFCDHLNGLEEYTFENWDRGRFDDVWGGTYMTRLRREHLQRLAGAPIKLCGECNWCYDRRYVDLETLIDPSQTEFEVSL